MNQQVKKLRNDLLQIIYPQHCYGCEMELVGSKAGVCPVCTSDLEYTLYENYEEETPLDQLFWGRVHLVGTYSLLYFNKSGISQNIIHNLKYNSRRDLGHYYGMEIGKKLKNQERFQNIQGLIPVPLHPKKQFIRGYNQAEEIAKGISETTGIPIRMDLLKRTVFSESQTKKSFLARWDSMQNTFNSTKKVATNEHFLLVDDVITTGSTLEICVRELQEKYQGIQISVASLACGK